MQRAAPRIRRVRRMTPRPPLDTAEGKGREGRGREGKGREADHDVRFHPDGGAESEPGRALGLVRPGAAGCRSLLASALPSQRNMQPRCNRGQQQITLQQTTTDDVATNDDIRRCNKRRQTTLQQTTTDDVATNDDRRCTIRRAACRPFLGDARAAVRQSALSDAGAY